MFQRSRSFSLNQGFRVTRCGRLILRRQKRETCMLKILEVRWNKSTYLKTDTRTGFSAFAKYPGHFLSARITSKLAVKLTTCLFNQSHPIILSFLIIRPSIDCSNERKAFGIFCRRAESITSVVSQIRPLISARFARILHTTFLDFNVIRLNFRGEGSRALFQEYPPCGPTARSRERLIVDDHSRQDLKRS